MPKIGFDYPSQTPMVSLKTGVPTITWEAVFTHWHAIIETGQQSGATTARPTSQLWIGRFFFDTTLGKPVWVKSVQPTVWVDGSGAVV